VRVRRGRRFSWWRRMGLGRRLRRRRIWRVLPSTTANHHPDSRPGSHVHSRRRPLLQPLQRNSAATVHAVVQHYRGPAVAALATYTAGEWRRRRRSRGRRQGLGRSKLRLRHSWDPTMHSVQSTVCGNMDAVTSCMLRGLRRALRYWGIGRWYSRPARWTPGGAGC